MKKFLRFHDVKGDSILVAPEHIQAIASNSLQPPSSAPAVPVTVLYFPWGALNVKENFEQTEAILAEADYAG